VSSVLQRWNMLLLDCAIKILSYLRVYKPHFFDKNLTSKIGVRLMHGILCPFDE
jgi:hypothetical protein